MKTPPNSCLVKVVTPERQGLVPELSSNTPNSKMCYSPASVMKANPCAGPIIMSVASNANRDAFRQEEESVVSVPEQMPEDELFEVSLTTGDFLNMFTLISSEGKKLSQARSADAYFINFQYSLMKCCFIFLHHARYYKMTASLAEDVYIICCGFLCTLERLSVMMQRIRRSYRSKLASLPLILVRRRTAAPEEVHQICR
ncbi:hypothetical protein INR49_015018 [Caranx melampygus]|nr:hypothetical protein INR49_015018 [Caranx melampygus]